MNETATIGNDKQEQWCKEQAVNILFSNALASITGSLGVILVLAVSLSFQPVHMPTLAIWTAAGIIIAIGRLALWRGYFHTVATPPSAVWLTGYRFMTLMSGLLNGLSVCLFFSDVSAAHQLLFLFSIAGLTAAATGTHAIDRFTFNSFMYAACILTMIKVFFMGEPTYYALCLMLLFFLLVMRKTGRQNHSIIHDNLVLTYKMQYRATHDTLVNLLNREEFENQFETRLAKTRHGVAILFIDLDNFKQLNDQLGHRAGDDALVQVANIIRTSIRHDDIAARLGGDEFVVTLLLDDPQEAMQIAQTILMGVGAITFPGKHDFKGLGTSIGIGFHHNNQIPFSKLLHIADLACYESKAKGKNQVNLRQVEEQ